eukprot:TRINITY_DN1934_c0_g1_i1.p1 TRINITY_DN1934_c0_g1~~TRINITY_DN1934_c0_g1_i1.p1  ORF type:complete len:521 (-),score=110.11 TRINITY_DN1934_c0_g1_i1:56-1618(-)
MLEGDQCLVIVDTLESVEAAEPVLQEFRKISQKPIRAIIYTHNHPDHVLGSTVFAGIDSSNSSSVAVDVYSHETTLEILKKTKILSKTTFTRGMRQFGAYLSTENGDHLNSGIGPRLVHNSESRSGFLLPNKIFSKKLDVEICGLNLELLHAPGETDDQIVVWVKNTRALLAADNFYRAFPNLYAIRGTPTRDAVQWVGSLDLMRGLLPLHLIPSHSRPLSGQQFIFETLTAYRDAIQYVHDQTVRLINKGLGPDEIAHQVRLPEELEKHPFLQEFYGRVEWSVRGIFAGYLGWFSGDALDLSPLARPVRASHLAHLAGGPSSLLQKAKEAFEKEEYQWSLELAHSLMVCKEADSGVVEEATRLKSECLRRLGSQQTSANGRNYYLTQALENDGLLRLEPGHSQILQAIKSSSLDHLFQVLAVSLDPQRALGLNQTLLFHFDDDDQEEFPFYYLHVRHSILEVKKLSNPFPADIRVRINSEVWREILAKQKNPVVAYAQGLVNIEKGSELALVTFLRIFS